MLVDILDVITDLSHEFGTAEYVRAGGGNTSAKTQTTLWVKPSGTTLAHLKPSDFVALDRRKLGALYTANPPSDVAAREAMVKELMAQAVLPSSHGRPSVEAPLHDSLGARYVVHTHPALVNGMTCGKEGKAACRQYFPQALWVDYVDPGYTLCMEVRKAVADYQAANGREPAVIFLKNHGVFAAGEQADDIRALYIMVMRTLQRHYADRSISCKLPVGPEPDPAEVAAAREMIRQAFADPTLCVAASGAFALPDGPISPDHIVYAKSYYLTEKPTPQAVAAFRQKHGYLPQVIAFGAMVLGVGQTAKKAALALELAMDGALVKQLAEAFGGIDYMTDAARTFIENWEVESYRSRQVQ